MVSERVLADDQRDCHPVLVTLPAEAAEQGHPDAPRKSRHPPTAPPDRQRIHIFRRAWAVEARGKY